MSHITAQYTSDLTDEQWCINEPLLPVKRSGAARPIELDMRAVLDATLYLVRTGYQWDDIPKSYPNHNSMYYHYRKWTKHETWRASNDALRQIVEKEPNQKGFRVLPRRWVVERTFAWFGRYRRLGKNYERNPACSEGVIYIASIHTMLRRLAA